jgi:hypothetical protein
MARSAWVLVAGALGGCLVGIDDVRQPGDGSGGVAGSGAASSSGGGGTGGGPAGAGGSPAGAGGSPAGAGGAAGDGSIQSDGPEEAASDAGSETADAVPDVWSPHCPGGVLPIQDDFEDGKLDANLWAKYATANAGVYEKEGVLEFDIDISATPTSAYAWSQKTYDASGCSAFVEISEVTKDSSAYSAFALTQSPGTYVAFVKYQGNLELKIGKDGTDTELLIVPYNPLWQRFWRLRVHAAVHWDVSADGIAWTELLSAPLPFPMSAVTLLLQAEAEQPESVDPGRFRVASVNVPPQGP